MTNREEIDEIIEKIFEIYDGDNSGYLEIGEIRKLLDDTTAELGGDFASNEKIHTILKSADDNDDSKLDVEEVKKLLRPILENNIN